MLRNQKGKKLKKIRANDFLKVVIISANDEIKYHQGLIDEWNEPKDIAQRAAEIIKKIHQHYALAAYATLLIVEKKSDCKHSKKFQKIYDKVRYCGKCYEDLEKKVKSKKKK